jgi:ABC-type Mn2+/Zn2+ transport system ATPase subunit
MRSKLMLLLALSHSAELMILDEPMEGLDPAANEEVPRELMGLATTDTFSWIPEKQKDLVRASSEEPGFSPVLSRFC